MKISDIIAGTKRRKHRNPRKHRITQRELYTVDTNRLSEGARIQHVEDLTIWDGSAGAKRALNYLRRLESSPGDVTIKWDGKPAVIFGRNEKGQFVLTDKSAFGATTYDGRVTSKQDLRSMIANRKSKDEEDRQRRNAFADQMAGIWDYFENATPKDFRGYVHGDLLFFTTPKLENGKLVFEPNTTTYYADPRSDIGRKIANSKIGVVLHQYIDLDGNKSSADASKFVSSDLLVMPPVFVTHTPDIDLPEVNRLEDLISKNSSQIDDLINVPAELKMSNFKDILYTYINNKTKSGQLENLGQDFMEWAEKSNLSDPKKKRLLDYISQKKQGFGAIFQVIAGIMNVKNKIIYELDNQPADITAKTDGKPGGEGYVIGAGDAKLVNRSEFTAANMARNN